MVLSRHRDESVIVAAGTPYETLITVVDIRGDKTRLGFKAGPEVTIHRSEVQAAIDRENRERAAQEAARAALLAPVRRKGDR